MNYLLDKRKRSRKFSYVVGILIIGVVIILATTRTLSPLGGFFDTIATPFWRVGNSIDSYFAYKHDLWRSKKSLVAENILLNEKISSLQAGMIELEAKARETDSLREIFGRTTTIEKGLLAVVLAKPSQSPYDTLVIDQGANNAVSVGDKVFAYGNIPIGFIGEAYNSSSKVILYSQSKHITNVILSGSNISIDLIGRGGQNFEATLPRDILIPVGTFASLPSLDNVPVAVVSSVISDPRDPFQKILLTSPVNVQYLKYVEVKK